MSHQRWLLLGVSTLLGCLLLTFTAQAQVQIIDDDTCTTLGINCPTGTTGEEIASGVSDIILNVLNILLGLLALIAVIVIIYAGVKYILSGGDEDRAKDAKRIILYAIIGLVIIGLSATVVNFVINTFFSSSDGGVVSLFNRLA
jgi:type IV secretory pathway VirB2 component (pilin)